MSDYTDNKSTISSPESTERLLFDYLRPDLERTHERDIQYDIQQLQRQPEELNQYQLFRTRCWDDTFLSIEEEESNLMLELNTFTDLKVALKDIEELDPLRAHQKKQWSTTEEDLIDLSSTNFTVPPSIRLTIESSHMLEMLMARAVQHWCCIGFKVAPIQVSLIQDWRRAPQAIVYCIASISLVTFMDQENTSSSYSKQAAMVFYEQARNKLDDILFDDMQPSIIQSYFCLSYTSNLLRLYEQQRTWGGLASISLQHLAKNINSQEQQMVDPLTLGCWFRWYYVDAWMCLTLNRDCLLPDHIPWMDMKMIERLSITYNKTDDTQLYGFASLTCYMRKYIRALNSGKLFSNDQQKLPSPLYYQITRDLVHWYSQLGQYNTISQLHLNICYNSMRLVVLYQFLAPQQPPPKDVIIDCLQTNLELLQALQELKDVGCDQSTYHHMFFAIHNTAKRIYQYNRSEFIALAKDQLQINLILLKSTQAYAHDVFKMKIYADKIQDQFTRMKIFGNLPVVMDRPLSLTTVPVYKNNRLHSFHHHYHYHQRKRNNQVPSSSVIVFKRENIKTIKRRRRGDN
ncbi:hypothetical protein BD770DRAFT_377687 [Pilaira anomala]|nr:hypothetical protein BD770DRAFT_377687 [Pilaira anomala]